MVHLGRETIIVLLVENCIYLSFFRNIKQFLSFTTIIRKFHYSYHLNVKFVLFFIKIAKANLFISIDQVMAMTHWAVCNSITQFVPDAEFGNLLRII